MRAPRERSRDDAIPEAVRLSLWRCARGELAANVALGQLFMNAANAAQARRALHEVLRAAECEGEAATRLRNALDLWERTPDAFTTVKHVLQIVDSPALGSGPTPRHWAQVFDRAAEISPAAGVAVYSLGRPDLLEAASGEIVERMGAWGLLAPGCVTLEIGCGNGRILRRVATQARFAIGIDVSSRMLAQARALSPRECPVGLVRSSGTDLACFAAECVDLVYAVDTFPYLVQSELARAHIVESARVLKCGSHLLILNYSYGGNYEADRAEIATLGEETGLTLLRAATRDFAFWDGAAFLLQKA